MDLFTSRSGGLETKKLRDVKCYADFHKEESPLLALKLEGGMW